MPVVFVWLPVRLELFEANYAAAKEYISHLRTKVVRVHCQIPVKIIIYVNL